MGARVVGVPREEVLWALVLEALVFHLVFFYLLAFLFSVQTSEKRRASSDPKGFFILFLGDLTYSEFQVPPIHILRTFLSQLRPLN